jgi:protein involved in polysaccharide export with SLBB domain
MKALGFLLIGLVAAGLTSCAGKNDPPQRMGAAESISDPTGPVSQLAKIKAARAADNFVPSFALGPGDVLEISAPDVTELRNRTVRVSPKGVVELPVIGAVEVQGLDEEQLTRALQNRLSRYVKDPEVNILIEQSYSRDVAVVGAVVKPGLYALNSSADTLLDMINRAGGWSERRSAEVIFIPAGPSNRTNHPNRTNHQMLGAASLLGAAVPSKGETGNPSASLTDGSQRPIRAAKLQRPQNAMRSEPPITTGEVGSAMAPQFLRQQNPTALTLYVPQSVEALDVRARPGDVIIVPYAGQVMLQGWVRNPGAYPISSGMTALGAITAAGGQMFTSSATLLRPADDGTMVDISLDLSAIEKSQAPDVNIQGGDVIILNGSVAGAVPYFFYSLFGHFGTGVSAGATAF